MTESVHDDEETVGLRENSLEDGIDHNTLTLRIHKTATYNLIERRTSRIFFLVEWWELVPVALKTRGGARVITSSFVLTEQGKTQRNRTF